MPSSAQGLFLASYPGIPPDGAHINLSDIGDQSGVSCMQHKYLASVQFLCPAQAFTW